MALSPRVLAAMGVGTAASGAPGARRSTLPPRVLRAMGVSELDPDAEEPEPFIARAARAIGSAVEPIAHAVSTPFRGLGMLATAAQEQLADPMSGIGETPGSRLKLSGPGLTDVESPSLPQLALEGLGMPTGAREVDVRQPSALVPEAEDEILQAARAQSRALAIAEPVATMGLQFATDPALAGLSGLSQVAQRGAAARGLLRGGEVAPAHLAAAQRAATTGTLARLAQRGVGAAFVPGMVEGAVEGGRQFLEAGDDPEQGYTSPEALRGATEALVHGGMAAFTGYHAAGAHRTPASIIEAARAQYGTPAAEVVQGGAPPPGPALGRAPFPELPPAPPGTEPGPPTIDVAARVVPPDAPAPPGGAIPPPGPVAPVPPPAAAPAPAQVPFVLTKRMGRELRRRGYTPEQIDQLRPEEAQQILARPISAAATAASVPPEVVPPVQDLQVPGDVVERVPIDVVDVLAPVERAPSSLLGDPAMLPDRPPIPPDVPVPGLVPGIADAVSAVQQPDEGRPALLAAEGSRTGSELRRPPENDRLADRARDLNAASARVGQESIRATPAAEDTTAGVDVRVPPADAGPTGQAVVDDPRHEAPIVSATGERRVNAERRRSIAEMSAEELRVALLTDDLTGLGNRRAYEDAARKPVQIKLDSEGLKWVNDTIGMEAGNQVLRTIGEAIRDEGGGYRLGGDEFALQADTPELAERTIAAVKERLANATLTFQLPDGTTKEYRGVGLHHGIGGSFDEADLALNAAKKAAVERGERAARGEQPRGLREVVAPREQADQDQPPAPPAEVAPPPERPPAPQDPGRASVDLLPDFIKAQMGRPSPKAPTPQVEPAAEPPAAPAPSKAQATSVRVKFPKKPSPAVLQVLRDNGFTWDKTEKEWRGTPTDFRRRVAQDMVNTHGAAAKLRDSIGGTVEQIQRTGPTPQETVAAAEAPPVPVEIPEESRQRIEDAGFHIEDPLTGVTIQGKAPSGVTRPEGVSSGERPADVDTDVPAKPADEPQAPDRGALARVSPDDVPATEGAGAPPGGAPTGGRPDEGGLPQRRPAAEDEPGPSLGAREGGVGVSPREPGPEPAERPQSTDEFLATLEEAVDAPRLDEPAIRNILNRKRSGRDYRITEEALGKGGPKAKATANLEAIKLLKAIEADNRLATPEEQAVLVQYVGWGSLPQLFGYQAHDAEWRSVRQAMDELLSREEFEAARHSTINAHFTSAPVGRAMWDAVARLGIVPHSRMLEPAMGIGHFFGWQPDSTLPAKRTGVELDPTSGRIARLLYPHAGIFIKGLQQTKLPKDHYDLTISNFPFANVTVHDSAFAKHPEVLKSLHDYFFAKTLDLTRPGGLVATITTRYTLDKKDSAVRDYLAARAEFVGAIRLPNTAFKANAGTEVVTDIVFLRKLLPGEKASGESWTALATLKAPNEKGERVAVEVNEYFKRHSEMVLGEHSMTGSMYRDAEYTVTGTVDPARLQAAIEKLPKDIVRPYTQAEPEKPVLRIQVGDADAIKQDAFAVKDGKLVVRRGEFYEPATMAKTDEPRVRGMIGVRDAVRKVLNLQINDAGDTELKKAQKELGTTYDLFVKRLGVLSDRKNARAFVDDPDAPLLLALENYDPDTGKATKAPIFSKRTVARYEPPARAEGAAEAMAIALSETGGLDWRRMEGLTGKSKEALRNELGPLAYENPEGARWETAESYLSGNVREKLAIAESAAAGDERFKRNVEALKAALPKDLEPREIHVRLGSPWVPREDVAGFLAHVLDIPEYRSDSIQIGYAKELGLWTVAVPQQFRADVAATERWGTQDIDAAEIVGDLLNLREPTVWVTERDGSRHVDQDATLAAREKASNLHDEFRKWLWKDDARATRLARAYNDAFNNLRIRKYDGSHLVLPGMARLGLRDEDLAPHQKNAVWRIINTTPRTNALLNHAVGAGKTFELVAGVMERIRVGLSKKAAIAVPNHIIAQWGADFRRLYPTANVLVVGKRHATPQGRKQLMSRIATGDHHAVIMSFEAMGKLPVRRETFKRFVEAQIAEYETAIMAAMAETGETRSAKKSGNRIVKELEKARERLETKLANYLKAHEKDDAVTWEDLGIDMLAVDEAHGFKRLDVPSKLQVAGIARGGSQRAMDLFMKGRYLNERGGILVFATGTPITNTMGEAYIIQRFLQPELLKERGIEHFDSWAANFGESRTGIELDATGKFRQKTRFTKFVNVSDLSTMLAETMDTMLPEQLNLPVPKSKVVTHVAPPTDALREFIAGLADRADHIRTGRVDPKVDNFLKITTDGRKAGTDMRLVRPGLPDDPGSKINMAVGSIFDIWKRTAERKSTQLVFLDLSTPKAERGSLAEGEKDAPEPREEEVDPDTPPADEETAEERQVNVSLYNEIRDKLVRKGVPREEVAFIHDIKTDADKTRINNQMNSGAVRVLLGSTAKMGTGLNVQRKLKAGHIISPPYRPDQIEQAEGRVIRQGNEHYDLGEDVELHRYATEGSYDAVMWQMLENKIGFIHAFQRAEPGVREVEDTGQVVLSYAQMKAIASGNPKILEKVALDADVSKLQRLEAQWDSDKRSQRHRLEGLKDTAERVQRRLDRYTDLASRYDAEKAKAGKDFAITVGKASFSEREAAGNAIDAEIDRLDKEGGARKSAVKIGEYLGFPLTVKLNEQIERKAGKTTITWEPALTITQESVNLSESALGTIQSMESVLRGLESRRDSAKGDLAHAKREHKELEGEIAKEWPHTEKLARGKKRQKELDDELREKDKPRTPVATEGDEGATPPAADGGQSALKRLRGRRGGKSYSMGAAAAEGAEVWRDVTAYGASLMARGIRKFADWGARMREDLGGTLRDLPRHLRNVYARARQEAPAAPAGATTPPPPRWRRGPQQAPAPAPEMPDLAGRLADEAVTASNRAKKIADTFEATNRKFDIAQEGADRVQERGTIAKEDRVAFRKAGQPDREETYSFRFSEKDIEESTAEMVAAEKVFQDAERSFNESADPNSAQAMRVARQIVEQAVKNWQVYRSAGGRAVGRFNQGVPEEVIQRLREASLIAGNLRNVRTRVPIATNILHGVKGWKDLSTAERQRVGRDIVDHFRLNLFSVTSWTLDMIGDAGELVGQVGAGLGHDFVRLGLRGDASFPSMQGVFRAIRAGGPFRRLRPDIEEQLGTTVSGERMRRAPGAGVFTYRGHAASKAYDALVGWPLYAKQALDTAAKRLGTLSTLYREGIEAATAEGLRGQDLRDFVDRFVLDPPAEALHRAVENGKKAGFNRDLSELEERAAGSTTARLLVDTFMRWPFQFTRWAAEMLGWRPDLLKKLRAGSLRAEEVGEWLGKAAVGLGGLLLINGLYDRTDFNSMEYVDEDGNRIRLSGRDPIPTALWFLAIVRGDKEKAATAIRHASIPGGRLLAGEGGLLGGTIEGFLQAIQNPQNDPRALRRELENVINRAFPGQAILSAIKTAFDPTIREGLGANLPGASFALPAAVDPVTGRPLRPRQRVLGVDLPSIAGVPIPGATRLLDPVQKLLSRYGLLVYRGPRSPVAGYPPGQVPPELRREWQEVFGEARNKLLGGLARAMPSLERQDPERVRKMIQARDRAAAEIANREMRRRYGGPRKLPRQATRREIAGPDIFRRRSEA